MNDPWAGPVAEPPKITAHQVSRIITLIEDYTATEADALIATLVTSRRRAPVCCSAEVGHTRTCPTQGRD